MYYSEPNKLTEQLDGAGYNWNNSHNFKIRSIVEEFFRTLDTKGLTEQEAQELFRIIYALGSTKSLAPEGHTVTRYMNWIPYQVGRDGVGTLTRILPDAFSGPQEGLNYKVGVVSRLLANGQVSVYLRTFGVAVPVDTDKLEVVHRKRF